MSPGKPASLWAFDHLSLWEIAHRWHDEVPPSDDAARPSLAVQDSLRILAFGLFLDQLHVLSQDGTEYINHRDVPTLYHRTLLRYKTEGIPNDIEPDQRPQIQADIENLPYSFIEDPEHYQTKLRIHRETLESLNGCLEQKRFDRRVCERIHLRRDELLDFCLEEALEPPAFWYSADDIKQGHERLAAHDIMASENIEPEPENTPRKKGRHKQTHEDRDKCREIAARLWREDPTLRITDIVTHRNIQIKGNGKLYPGRDTIRNWIRDLDPRSPEEKKRRSPKRTKDSNDTT